MFLRCFLREEMIRKLQHESKTHADTQHTQTTEIMFLLSSQEEDEVDGPKVAALNDLVSTAYTQTHTLTYSTHKHKQAQIHTHTHKR